MGARRSLPWDLTVYNEILDTDPRSADGFCGAEIKKYLFKKL